MVQALPLSTGLLRSQSFRLPRIFCRHKSITAAIERGKRDSDDQWADRPRRQDQVSYRPVLPRTSSTGGPTQRNWQGVERTDRTDRRRADVRERREGERTERRDRERIIESLPYSTAASEFIYGYSSVLAAIKANRRKLYRLYIDKRGSSHSGSIALIERAKQARIYIVDVGSNYESAMDKASSGRPHNGFVLEASPLPAPPLLALEHSSKDHGEFHVDLDHQNAEDRKINGTKKIYTYGAAGWRYPLILYVDGVLDEGNLGAIARSAYFLGVDAIVTPVRQSAPWSHIAMKASAGAAEAIPVFKVNQPTDFLGRSARAGWRLYASDAIPPVEQPVLPGTTTPPNNNNNNISSFASSIIYTFARSTRRLPADHCPVASHPTVLMMGAEGTGLRSSLLNMAHYKVGIRHGRDADEVGVDSLNVSVATSLLCYQMLEKPLPKRKEGDFLF